MSEKKISLKRLLEARGLYWVYCDYPRIKEQLAKEALEEDNTPKAQEAAKEPEWCEHMRITALGNICLQDFTLGNYSPDLWLACPICLKPRPGKESDAYEKMKNRICESIPFQSNKNREAFEKRLQVERDKLKDPGGSSEMMPEKAKEKMLAKQAKKYAEWMSPFIREDAGGYVLGTLVKYPVCPLKVKIAHEIEEINIYDVIREKMKPHLAVMDEIVEKVNALIRGEGVLWVKVPK